MSKLQKMLGLVCRDVRRKLNDNVLLLVLAMTLFVLVTGVIAAVNKGDGGLNIITLLQVNYNFRAYFEQAIIMLVFFCFMVRKNKFSSQISLGSTRTSYYISNLLCGVIFCMIFSIFAETWGHLLKFILSSANNTLVGFTQFSFGQIVTDIGYNFVVSLFIFTVVRLIRDLFARYNIVAIIVAFAIVGMIFVSCKLIIPILPNWFKVSHFLSTLFSGQQWYL